MPRVSTRGKKNYKSEILLYAIAVQRELEKLTESEVHELSHALCMESKW